MKSYCKGYSIDEEKVRKAFADWSKHDSGRKNIWRVEAEHGGEAKLERQIAEEIRCRRLAFAPMKSYQIKDGANGKLRTITVESCKQQVCDYLAVHALQPMLDARTGFWQYGSAHVRSNIELAHAVQRWEHDTSWWVHLDICKCYQSIGTDMLCGMLRRYVRSGDVLYLLDSLLAMHGSGLTLGSYLSLRLAQWVLSFGYHHVESLHKTRRGASVPLVSHQGWYVDDAWLLGRRKRDVQAAARSLEGFLAGYGLSLHPWQACRVGDEEPIDVAGYVVRPGRISIRGMAFLRIDRARRRYRAGPSLSTAQGLASRKGQLMHSDSRRYMASHGGDLRSACRLISRLERRT